MSTVYFLDGTPYDFEDDKFIAVGGEAKIFETAKPHVLFKLFTRENMSLMGKLKTFLLASQANYSQFKTPVSNYAFPLMVVFKNKSQNTFEDIVGYFMYRQKGSSLHSLVNLNSIKKGRSFTNTTRLEYIDMCIALLEKIDALHKMDVLIGDVNLNNFLYDEESREVSIIDTDSFQYNALAISRHDLDTYNAIGRGNKGHKKTADEIQRDLHKMETRMMLCEVGVPEYAAPEYDCGNFAKERTLHNELFSIAALLFELLMFGKQPYVRSNCSKDYMENKQKGNFPYTRDFENMPNAPLGSWALLWSNLSHDLQDAFIDTFAHNGDYTRQRVTVEEWIDLLKEYKKSYGRKRKVPLIPKDWGEKREMQNFQFIAENYISLLEEL